MEHPLLQKIENGVATLTLNRPESLNAFSEGLFDALGEAIPRLNRDPAIAVIVLTGAGRAFSAGGDIKAMKGTTSSLTFEARSDELKRKHEAIIALHESPKVTISSINGVAAGAGLGWALACDFRLAAKSARLISSFVKIGLSGDNGGTYFLSRLVGVAKAQELFLLGEPISSEDALRLGILSRVFDDSDLADGTARLAAGFAQGATLAHRWIKNNFQRATHGTLQEVLDSEAINTVRLATSADHTEAITAFKEKRKPVFQGR